MLLRSRRKPASGKTKAAEPHLFLGLPEDILILVLSHCRVDELLAFRLTNSRIRDLISRYISTIAPSVARSTFPHSEHILRPLDKPAQYTLGWLKSLIFQHLAAILVDRHRIADEWTQSRYGIPAEDSFGDELRARVANGWRVLYRFSNICHEVNAAHAKGMLTSRVDLANKLLRPSRFQLELLQRRETLVFERRRRYLTSLSSQHAKDYRLTIALLSAAFSTSISNVGSEYEPWIFDAGDGMDGQRSLRKGQSWLAWFILARGPELFWQQWWSLPAASSQNYIRDLARSSYLKLPEALVDHQRQLARNLQVCVNDAADAHQDFDASNPFPYFREYARAKRERESAGVQMAIPDVMAEVPFRVNFRCPEDLLKRTAALMEAPRAMVGSGSRNE